MTTLYRYAIRRGVTLIRAAIRHCLFRLHACIHKSVTITTKQGRLTMSTRDHGIAEHLFRTRQFEYDYSLRAVRFLKAKGVVGQDEVRMLDIGANIGVISIGLLLAGEIDSAIAIEPEPNNFDLLVTNTQQNGLSKRLLCCNIAAGDTASTLTMELSPDNPGDHRIRSRPTENAYEKHRESTRQTIQIQSLPLGQILQRPEICQPSPYRPSLLWIDVQGYEGFVFAGARDVLSTGIPVVSEIWPYGIQRAGMRLDRFASLVADTWSHYWIYRRETFIRYPISVFDCYLKELGTEGHFENVIFTKQQLDKTP